MNPFVPIEVFIGDDLEGSLYILDRAEMSVGEEQRALKRLRPIADALSLRAVVDSRIYGRQAKKIGGVIKIDLVFRAADDPGEARGVLLPMHRPRQTKGVNWTVRGRVTSNDQG